MPYIRILLAAPFNTITFCFDALIKHLCTPYTMRSPKTPNTLGGRKPAAWNGTLFSNYKQTAEIRLGETPSYTGILRVKLRWHITSVKTKRF